MANFARYLSSTSGFIPEATGQAIAYVRDPKRFKVNSYVQTVNAPKPVGVYALLDRDQPTRVVTDQEFAWEDGDPPPMGSGHVGTFSWVEFRCFRRAYPYAIGEEALENAEGWNPEAFFNAIILSQAMVNRTQRIITLLETVANWPTASTADANTLNGGAGKWTTASSDPASPFYLAIYKALVEAVRRVVLATNAMVAIQDLQLVISPGLAIAMAGSAEIRDYIKGSPDALNQIRGDVDNQNKLWGLPNTYAGIKLIVEDAVRVTTRPLANNSANQDGGGGTRTFIKQDNSAVLVSRPGGLDGNYGSPSFSTVQCYFNKYELAVEAKQDSWEKRVMARVVEKFKEVLAATASGFLITSTV